MRAAQTFQNKPFETGVSPTATLSHWGHASSRKQYERGRHSLSNILKLQAAFLYSIYHQQAGKTNLFHMRGGRFHAGKTGTLPCADYPLTTGDPPPSKMPTPLCPPAGSLLNWTDLTGHLLRGWGWEGATIDRTNEQFVLAPLGGAHFRATIKSRTQAMNSIRSPLPAFLRRHAECII